MQELEQFTRDLVNRLQSLSYEELAAAVDKRGALIDQLRTLSPAAEEIGKYRDRVQRVLDYDEIILGRLNELKNEAAKGMQKIVTGRKQRSVYEQAYTADGIFIDKRK